MVELKGLSEDVMKNDSDKANYNREFQDLQMQIYDLAQTQFNGVSLFAGFLIVWKEIRSLLTILVQTTR